jgi:hypothetical protein
MRLWVAIREAQDAGRYQELAFDHLKPGDVSVHVFKIYKGSDDPALQADARPGLDFEDG